METHRKQQEDLNPEVHQKLEDMGGRRTPIRQPGTSIPYVEIIQGPNKAD
jgi:hypothetical protein